MSHILDASVTINLHKGGLFGTLLLLTSAQVRFHIGVIVVNECGELLDRLNEHARTSGLVILPDDMLSIPTFSGLLERYGLGLGETECIALAAQRGLIVCTDDRAARRAAVRHLGEERVVGSLGLIRECVRNGHIGRGQAIAAYEKMKHGGAFLPEIPSEYFDC